LLIIAGELLKPPGSRKFYGGPYRRDLLGIGLVTAGFVLQGAGQAIAMTR
jgi:hypothetical protein